ncbi:MAG: MOSC domain-containing protein [Dehalococcoidia bacterium]|nr:MOSC domain-containing protein [Dehalococcoidia bacterium]
MLNIILESVNIGEITELNHANGTVKSGIFKTPTEKIVTITHNGINGDYQADLKAHGGPDKIVCVYPSEHHDWWDKELNINFQSGYAGENFTTKGLIEDTVCIGDQYQIGAAILEVSQPRQPCYKLAARHGDKSIARKVQQTGKTGFYFRCIQAGSIQAGEEIKLINRPNPKFTIEQANILMHIDKLNTKQMNSFIKLNELSDSWKKYFTKRIQTKHIDSDSYIVDPPSS